MNGNPFFIPVQNQVAPALSGLAQTIQGTGQILEQRRQQEAEMQRQQEARAEVEQGINDLNDAFQNEDYDKLAQLSIRYPQMGQNVMKLLGAKNERTRQDAVDTLGRLYLNPENAEQILGEREQLVLSEGGNPVDTRQFLETFRNNPEQALKQTKGYLAMAAPERYEELRDIVEPTSGITPYQQADLFIKQQGVDIRKLEAENKKLELSQRNETNELKRRELEQKIEDNKLKLEQKKKEGQVKLQQAREDAQSAITNSRDTLDLIKNIENHPGFSSYVGAKGLSQGFGIFDTPVAGTDAAGVAGMVETLTSQNFLDQIKRMTGMGALSNAEGEKISSAVTSLNPNMSEKDFRRSLGVIKRNMQRAIKKAEKVQAKFGAPEQATETVESNIVEWGDL